LAKSLREVIVFPKVAHDSDPWSPFIRRFAVKLLPFIFPVLLLLSGSFADARSSPFAQPKLVKVPGTKVSLVPPATLKPSDRFPGFGDEETKSSIMITEMPAPYSEMAKAMTKEAWAAKGEPLATKGMTMLSRKEISLNGRPGIKIRRKAVDAN
jgi:hypothetical protein